MEGRDRINELPLDILDNILGLLSIEEAARTAILSTFLRDAWYGLTQLNFGPGFARAKFYGVYHYLDAIKKVLKHHRGPIRKFSFYYCWPVYKPDFDKLLRFVTQKGVEELYIESDNDCFRKYRLPYCIYTCRTLKILHLTGVRIEPISPPCIFPNVTSLYFRNVYFGYKNLLPCAIDVPLLQDMSFNRCVGIFCFNIMAPKLGSLTINNCSSYDMYDVDDEDDDGNGFVVDDDDNVDDDNSVSFSSDDDDADSDGFSSGASDSNSDSIGSDDEEEEDDDFSDDDGGGSGSEDVEDEDIDTLGGGFLPFHLDLRSIHKLHLCCDSIEYFVDEYNRKGLQRTALNVEYLEISGVLNPKFDNIYHFTNLLQKCPRLRELSLYFKFHDSDSPTSIGDISNLLEGLHGMHETHYMLRTLNISIIKGSKTEMLFMKGLLACFPTCQKLSISCCKKFSSRMEFEFKQTIKRLTRPLTIKSEIAFIH
ncbi:unnamed protein product [Cuscuta europaea]|uniref:At1g61320/AtMIF1 LRR domain-containing protein n=1 Tax=Cuscuta europaea TaxID=41803 RepID=A0A9P1EAX8_CUSEU|nr:unnamed protein product [Cuscuta europaea]